MRFTLVYNPIVNFFVPDERGNAAMIARAVDRIQMVVVAVWLGFLCVDILAERGFQVGCLQIVRGERVSGEQRMYVAACDEERKSIRAS